MREQIGSHAALRGIAALCVVAYHLQFGSYQHFRFEDATYFFRRSYLLVDLFFILSGFILSYVNHGDRSKRLTPAVYRDFIARRLIRLYPLLLFTLCAMVAFTVLSQGVFAAAGRSGDVHWTARSIGILLSQVFMLNAWSPLPGEWNIPSWSISAELFAYLLFPVFIGLHLRRPRLVTSLLLLIAIAFYAHVAQGTRSLDIISFPAPLRCLAGFSLGMVIYFMSARLAALPAPALAVAQIAALAWAVACLALPVDDVLIIPGFCLLVATTWTDRGPAAWLLVRRPLLYLGEISYSIYLNHVPIITMLHAVWPRVARRLSLSPGIERACWLVLCYAAVLIISHFTYRMVEVASRRALTRRILGHPARALVHSAPAL